jgi:hypothetical protein
VLPALVAMPLLAGETLNRHRGQARPRQLRLLGGTVTVAVAALQGAAWYVNAAHYADGASTPAGLLGGAAWTPPGEWWPWLGVALSACLCVGALAFAGASGRAPARP